MPVSAPRQLRYMPWTGSRYLSWTPPASPGPISRGAVRERGCVSKCRTTSLFIMCETFFAFLRYPQTATASCRRPRAPAPAAADIGARQPTRTVLPSTFAANHPTWIMTGGKRIYLGALRVPRRAAEVVHHACALAPGPCRHPPGAQTRGLAPSGSFNRSTLRTGTRATLATHSRTSARTRQAAEEENSKCGTFRPSTAGPWGRHSGKAIVQGDGARCSPT